LKTILSLKFLLKRTLVFDEKLLFPDHVTSITNNSMRLLGLLYGFTEIKNLHSLSMFYKTFISFKIEYCSVIWNMASISNLSYIDSVLNFFLAIVKCERFSMVSFSNLLL